MIEQKDLTALFVSWGSEFARAKVKPLSNGLSKNLVSCLLAEQTAGEVPVAFTNLFHYKLTESRCKGLDIKLQPWAMAFLSLMGDTPGEIVKIWLETEKCYDEKAQRIVRPTLSYLL